MERRVSCSFAVGGHDSATASHESHHSSRVAPVVPRPFPQTRPVPNTSPPRRDSRPPTTATHIHASCEDLLERKLVAGHGNGGLLLLSGKLGKGDLLLLSRCCRYFGGGKMQTMLPAGFRGGDCCRSPGDCEWCGDCCRLLGGDFD